MSAGIKGRNVTTEPVQAGNFSGILPEWGRTEDVARHFGIKRGTLYNLHAAGKVRGKVLRVRGKLTGVRLWELQSIREFINSQPDTIAPEDHSAPVCQQLLTFGA